MTTSVHANLINNTKTTYIEKMHEYRVIIKV